MEKRKNEEILAGAHLISREGRPEDQIEMTEQLEKIKRGRKTVKKTLKPHYSKAEKEFAKALGHHQSQPSSILMSEI